MSIESWQVERNNVNDRDHIDSNLIVGARTWRGVCHLRFAFHMELCFGLTL